MTITGTYDPADNKLRLRAESRLPKDLYERVRGAGFIWAPKQEFFVAPMWTPEREDLLIELCGEIGDEDTSLVDRAEQRAERFEDYSVDRKEDAEQAHSAVSAIADGIPFGQPILVGHHSERRARKDAERIESGMRKAIKMWDCSKYWADRAHAAVRHAKYLERPDVRARRIKKLEAEKRKQERNKAEAEQCYKFWRGECTITNKTTGESRVLAMTEENKETICKIIGNSGMDYSRLPVLKKDGESSWWSGWSAWNVLQPDGQRYAACPSCTVAQCVERAHQHYPPNIAHYQRWIAHYENRIAYEKAMLAEDGGTTADKTGPEVGGACHCWASPYRFDGGFSYIQKVNRVSVTVLRSFASGRCFNETVAFDKLSALMTAAQVKAARESGRLVESSCKCGFYLKPEAAPVEDNICPDGPSCPDPVCQEERKKIGIDPIQIEAMRDTLKQGIKIAAVPQLFPTPPHIAAQLVELAELEGAQRVLEPSAGTGAIVDAIKAAGWNGELKLELVEKNVGLAGHLASKYHIPIICGDFLEKTAFELGGLVDRVIMNPPFERGSDIAHIKHALTMLRAGGRLVAICANGPRQREAFEAMAEEWIDLPQGSFKDQGTNVDTAIVIINK